MKFAAIADWAEEGEFPVRFMCTELEVSPSGYYRWLAAQAAPLGPRASEDEELLRLIRTLHRYLSGNPGCAGSMPGWWRWVGGSPASGSTG